MPEKKEYWMPEDVYKTVTEWVPLPHVDLVFLRKAKEGGWETLIFKRKIDPFKDKSSLIGGRQFIGERILRTIVRQASEVGYRVRIHSPFKSDFPAYVDTNLDQDPNKQATTLVYPVEIAGCVPGMETNEVDDPRWVSIDALPENLIPNHRRKIHEAIANLKCLANI